MAGESSESTLGAPSATRQAEVDAEPKASTETSFTAFDGSAIEHSIETALGISTPFERLMALGQVYDNELVPTWAAFVGRAQKALHALVGQKTSVGDKIRDSHKASYDSLDAAFERDDEWIFERRAQAEAEATQFVAESNEVIKAVWTRVGAGLEIAAPKLSDSASGNSVGRGIVGAGNSGYASCRASAAALPVFGKFSDDPIIRKYLVWIAGAALIVGWMMFKRFGWGLFTAFWVSGGIAMLRQYTRSQAAETYQKLVQATAREQANRWAGLARLVEDCDGETERLGKVRDEGQARILDRINEELATNDAAFADKIAVDTAVWRQSAEQCSATIARLGAAVQTTVESDPLILGPVGPAVTDQRSGADLLRLRIGELKPTPLAALPADLASLLKVESQPSAILAHGLPAFWDLSGKRALIYVDDEPARGTAGGFIATIMGRILALLPPGKVNFTLFDPVGLGHNFAGFLELGDYAKELIGGQAWSDREHLRARLRDLIAHIETVTQKYLRNDFNDIESYNKEVGEIAEAYRFLVVADFPERFDDEIARDLDRIIQNGPRCGVFTLLHVNSRAKAAHGVDAEALRPYATELRKSGPGPEYTLLLAADQTSARAIDVDEPPSTGVLKSVVTGHGEGSKEAMQVKVAYERLLTLAKVGPADWWQQSSQHGIEVPLGPMGANKVQTFRLGVGLAHHALIVGRTRSGKSNLLHVLISTVARLYPPDEVQLYLIDFKKGVEFKGYADAQLPHARVIAVESEREFGLSVLFGLDDELKARGERFRTAGAVSISEFRKKTEKKLPRIILIVDEFQEFFTQDDRIHREARVLFDRLVRQGAAFGIHIVLGTQSLANAGLPASTRDQMAIRIALQSSDADSRLILGDDNPAARLLSRAGEAIYNDSAGQIEGNNLFQVAMFSDDDRSRELAATVALAAERKWLGAPPIVFEGHEPASLAASPLLASAKPAKVGAKLEMWLGEPIALKPPVAAIMKRQSGRNMLVLSKDEEQAVGVIIAALCSLAAQSTVAGCRFDILDYTSADAPWADHPEDFVAAIPHAAEVGAKREIKNMLSGLAAEVARRTEADGAKDAPKDLTIVLTILGLHRVRDLRASERASSLSMRFDEETEVPLADHLRQILRDGPDVGVHTLIWSDTYGSLERVLDRGALNEIGLRVSGPISGEESHRLFDSDVAAGIDKPHRMLKYDDDQVGVFEQFRPYALPSSDFIKEFGARLHGAPSPGGRADV